MSAGEEGQVEVGSLIWENVENIRYSISFGTRLCLQKPREAEAEYVMVILPKNELHTVLLGMHTVLGTLGGSQLESPATLSLP